MTASLYQITFTPTGGTAIRLLDYGDFLETPLAFGVRQQSESILPLGAPWGGTHAGGGTRRALTWQRALEHASHLAADSHIQRLTAILPFLTTGTLQVAVNGGEVWDLHDATILDSSARHATDGDFPTLENFQFDCGHTLPVSGLTWYNGIPNEWNLLPSKYLAMRHDGTFPTYELPQMSYRTVSETGANGSEKWFECGFTCDIVLTGSADLCWTGPDGLIRIIAQRSENLLTWAGGDFTDCPGSPTLNSDGLYDYWFRSKYPIDSAIKTLSLTASLNSPDEPRRSPIISVRIANVLQVLNYPYDLSVDAARLQADLIAAGWAGTTVVATSALIWTINIPIVNYTSYNTTTAVYWTAFLVPDYLGNLVNYDSNITFNGTAVNAAGVRTYIPHQFARLSIGPA